MSDFPTALTRHRCSIISAVADLVDRHTGSVSDTVKYHLGFLNECGERIEPVPSAMGKLIRATLVLLSAEAANGDLARVLPLAAIIELIHNSSLIHDDIEDLDQMRRHRATVWKLFGKPQSIVSGNFAIKIAHVAVSDLIQRGVVPARLAELHHKMTIAHLQMVEGQQIDIAAEQATNFSHEQYLRLIDLKTGALIALSLYVGAFIAPASEPNRALCDDLARLGWIWGRLFQVQDDIIGTWGDQRTGKPVGSDIQRKKKALPLLHLLQSTDRQIAGQAQAIISTDAENIGTDEAHQIIDLMAQADTQKWCQAQMDEYNREAQTLIAKLDLPKKTTKDLHAINAYLNTRTT